MSTVTGIQVSAVQPEIALAGAVVAGNDNPFPGLRPFRTGEEHLFFGRERQVDTMVDKLARTRFLAVVGTSGSGKSSLVNCGLRPALHRGLMTGAGPAWRVVQFRPGGDPIRAFARAIAAEGTLYPGYEGEVPLEEILETRLRMSNRGLVDVVRKARLPARTNLLVVVDQFEELFRYRSLRGSGGGDRFEEGEDATALVNLLLEATAHPEPIYVVLTMRSDFLGDCSLFQGLPEAINEGQYLVPRLTRDERRAAIAGPIMLSGAEVDPPLLTRLVNDVGDNPDQLSILQHALNRTWARWKEEGSPERPISLEDYLAIGTMTDALDRHADRAYGELPDERAKKICELIFKTLTDRGTDSRGIRRPTTFGILCAIADAEPAEVAGVIEVFREPSRSFLMPPAPEPLHADAVIDISHESLMRVWRRLEVWTREEAESARMYRRLADAAALYEEGKSSLWRDPELELALDWLDRQRPSAAWAELYDSRFVPTLAFLQRSREARDRELAEHELQRAWAKVRTYLAMACGLLFVAAIYWFDVEVANQLRGWLERNIMGPRLAGFIAQILVLVPPATVSIALFFAADHYGSRWFRRTAYHRVWPRPTQRPKPAAAQASVSAAAEEEAGRSLPTAFAPAWRRMVAFGLDSVFALTFLTVGLFLGAGLGPTGDDGLPTDGAMFAGLFLGLVVGWLYQVGGVRSVHRATLGMRVGGVYLTDLEGGRVSFPRATQRHLLKLLSYPYGIGLLMQPFSKKKQALHDRLSGTLVLTGRLRSRKASTPEAAIGDPQVGSYSSPESSR